MSSLVAAAWKLSTVVCVKRGTNFVCLEEKQEQDRRAAFLFEPSGYLIHVIFTPFSIIITINT